MPGLIDMHFHIAMAATSMVAFDNSFWSEIGARTALVVEDTLMNGFTPVKDGVIYKHTHWAHDGRWKQ